MTIYLDVVFLINLLYQLGILKMLAVLFRIGVSNGRILLGAALGSLLYCGCIVLNVPFGTLFINMTVGILIGIVSIVVTFFPMGAKRLGILILTHLFLAFCLSGILQLLPMNSHMGYLLLTSFGAILFLCFFSISVRKALFEKIRKEKNIKKIRVIHKGKGIDANGLIDTGNGLKDPISKEPVIVIQRSVAEALFPLPRIKEQQGYRVIPYGSIGQSKGLLEAFRLERLEIIGETNADKAECIVHTNILCAVYEENYKNGEYEVILHPFLF